MADQRLADPARQDLTDARTAAGAHHGECCTGRLGDECPSWAIPYESGVDGDTWEASLPGGGQVLARRDSGRFRVQGRRKDDGKMQYVASIGSPTIPDSSVRLKRAPVLKLYSDVVWSHDRQRMERREMYVDDENDYYKQTWYSLETGEVAFHKEGKLSDPDMHGESARRRRDAG
jgi:hypothetical protein